MEGFFYLSQFQPNNQIETEFKVISEIYLESKTDPLFQINSTQLNNLNTIATNKSVNSGRAIGVINYITKEIPPSEIPTQELNCENGGGGIAKQNNIYNSPNNVQHSKVSSLKERNFIFPNPTNNNLNLNLKEGYNGSRISIIDNLGKIVRDFSDVPSDGTLNISDLNSGVYFLKIENLQGEFEVLKLIIN